ncbi:MAG: hypothetical protein IIU69_02040, partial [Bacteroidaceae bacterium]|nr:hypothetical protein [Bacteroidaceae bacterium]
GISAEGVESGDQYFHVGFPSASFMIVSMAVAAPSWRISSVIRSAIWLILSYAARRCGLVRQC